MTSKPFRPVECGDVLDMTPTTCADTISPVDDETWENNSRATHTFDLYVEAEKPADEVLEEGRERLEFVKRERGHTKVSGFGFRNRVQDDRSDYAKYTFRYFTD